MLRCTRPQSVRHDGVTEQQTIYVSGVFNRPTGITLVQGHLSSFFQMPFKENDFIGMELIYNSVLVAAVQQGDSVLYMCVRVSVWIYSFSYCFPLGFMMGY